MLFIKEGNTSQLPLHGSTGCEYCLSYQYMSQLAVNTISATSTCLQLAVNTVSATSTYMAQLSVNTISAASTWLNWL